MRAENIAAQNDAQQMLELVSIVMTRPCINAGGTTEKRGTVIAYAELQFLKKRLHTVIQTLAAIDLQSPNK